jgi:hypothetical protein
MHKQNEKLKTLEHLMGLVESELRSVQNDDTLSDENYKRVREVCIEAGNLQQKIMYLREYIHQESI